MYPTYTKLDILSSSSVIFTTELDSWKELDFVVAELDILSAIAIWARVGTQARVTWLELGFPETQNDPAK